MQRLLPFLALLLLAACGPRSRYNATLMQAEGIVDSLPDSTYRLVMQVDRSTFDRGDSALWQLLYVQSKWKTDRDIKADTTWQLPISFFTEQGDKERLAKSYYYKGLVEELNGRILNSMRNFLPALTLIEEVGDSAYIERISGNIGVIYYDNAGFDQAYPFYKRALEIDEALKDTVGMVVQIENLNYSFLLAKKYREMFSSIKKALHLAEYYSKGGIELSKLYNMVALAELYNNHNDAAIDWSLKSIQQNIGTTDIEYALSNYYLGEAYLDQNRISIAKSYFEVAAKLKHPNASLPSLRRLSEMATKEYEYSKAVQFERTYRITYEDGIVRIRRLDLLKIQKDYEEAQFNVKQDRERLLWIIIVCLILTIVVVVSTKALRSVYQRKRLKNEIRERAENIRNLEALLNKLSNQVVIANLSLEMQKKREVELIALSRNIQEEKEKNQKAERELNKKIKKLTYEQSKTIQCIIEHPKADMITKNVWFIRYFE